MSEVESIIRNGPATLLPWHYTSPAEMRESAGADFGAVVGGSDHCDWCRQNAGAIVMAKLVSKEEGVCPPEEQDVAYLIAAANEAQRLLAERDAARELLRRAEAKLDAWARLVPGGELAASSAALVVEIGAALAEQKTP